MNNYNYVFVESIGYWILAYVNIMTYYNRGPANKLV